ncbi:MAG: hypothetical protein QW756_07490 [Nitrososphaerota archaeon]
MRTSIAVLILVMLVLGAVGVVALNLGRTETVTQTTFNTVTVTSATTLILTATVGLGETHTIVKPMIPDQIASLMEELVPGSTSSAIYYVKLPAEPGVYKYSFAVFWRFGEENIHTIVLESPEGRRFSIMPGSLIQVRFASAKNIPNTPAPFGSNATLTEVAIDSEGVVRIKSWEMLPNIYGIPSQPQIEYGSLSVWVVKYVPKEMGDAGESLVARYYFLEIAVR